MSISIPMQVREGLAIEGVEGQRGLGFPAQIANLIAANYREAVAQDPAIQSIKMHATHGRVHPMEMMMGMAPERIPADFRVYPLGTIEDDNGEEQLMDLYLSEHPELEGHGLMAFNTRDAREQLTDPELPNTATMATLAYNHDDLDELLEALGADFSEFPPQAEM